MRTPRSVRPLAEVIAREPDFRRLFWAQLVSVLGDMMAPVALTFALLAGGTAADVGWVLAAEALSATVFLLFGGALADRVSRRDIIVVTDCVRAASQGLAAWIVLSGHAGVATLAPLAVLNGAAMGAFRPALTALIPSVVRRESLTEANAALGMTASTATLLGPALAGVIIAVASPGIALALDSATYALSAILTWPLARGRPERAGTTRLFDEMAAGWRLVLRTRWIGSVIAFSGFFQAVVLSALLVLGPVVAEEDLGGAPGWATLLTALGAGSLLGGLVAVGVKPRLPLLWGVVGMLAFALPILGLIGPLPLPVLAVEMLVCGVAMTVYDAWWLTALQQHVPDRQLAMVSSIDWLGSIALRPVGLAAAGVLVGVVGLDPLLLGAAVSLLIATAVTALVTGVRTFETAGAEAR